MSYIKSFAISAQGVNVYMRAVPRVVLPLAMKGFERYRAPQ